MVALGKQRTLITPRMDILFSFRPKRIEPPVTRTVPFFETVLPSTSVISGKPGLVRLIGNVTFMNLW